MKIIVTGAAGFIGFHTSLRLLKEGYEIIGIDNLNNYYDVNLKLSRLKEIEKLKNSKKFCWRFIKVALEDEESVEKIFKDFKPDVVVHLAAQAGVRYSLKNPKTYIDSNLIGFYNIIETSRKYKISNFLYASSSSVYGGNKNLPFNENHSVDHPVSLYAATKKSNEIIAHCYSHLYKMPSTGMRFFTVYGPWGRPDMAPMIFTKSIIDKVPIKVFNFGKMKRDFTFIDDVVEAIYRCVKKPAVPNPLFNKLNPDPSSSDCPFRVFNLGNNNSVELLSFIKTIEDQLGVEAIKEYLPMQPGDVEETAADTEALDSWIGFSPNTSLKDGIKKFIDWYKKYYL